MRAALIRELGDDARLGETGEPAPAAGHTLVEVLAAPLNPADVAVASGRFFAGHPPLPFVPGIECAGRVLASDAFSPGTLVYAGMEGMGLQRDGSLAERALAADTGVVALPDDVDAAVAAALGVAGLAAWLPLAWRAPVRPGETVLVLGATGVLGLVAVQAAKVLGAGRVVAAGRRPEALARAAELGADATVEIRLHEGGADAHAALAEALAAACGEGGPSLVVDPLWGEPLVAALEVAPRGARIVQIGQSAGAQAVIPSAHVRGKAIDLLGFTNFAVPKDVLHAALLDLVGHAHAGRIRVDLERVPLAEVESAWQRQVDGPRTKLVVVP
jgi:NADPH2:quinone reductase